MIVLFIMLKILLSFIRQIYYVVQIIKHYCKENKIMKYFKILIIFKN
jgi:hypothetical protein